MNILWCFVKGKEVVACRHYALQQIGKDQRSFYHKFIGRDKFHFLYVK